MNVTLFNFQKRENSTKVPHEKGAGVNVELKDGCSIYNPSFFISSMNPLPYNYLQWDNKYYWISDIVLERKGLWNVICNIDVLATYRTDIINTSAFVAYSSNNYDVNIPDNRLSTKAERSLSLNQNEILHGADPDNGTYIITYITDKPNYGLSGAIWADEQTAENISKCLNSAGMNNAFSDDLKKQLSNVNQAVRACRYVPFSNWVTIHGDAGYNPPAVTPGGGSSGGHPSGKFVPRTNTDGMAGSIFWTTGNPLYPQFAPPIVGAGNCTWYAWGRFYEICGKDRRPTLPVGNAGEWFSTVRGYEKGYKPRLGAVACFENHVSIVEEIKENGDIVTSNSAYPNRYFFMYPLSASNNYYDSQGGGRCQGFIYNSCV